MILTARCGGAFLMLSAICGLLQRKLGLFSWGGGLVCVERLMRTAGNKYRGRFFVILELWTGTSAPIYLPEKKSQNDLGSAEIPHF